jgi:transposase
VIGSTRQLTVYVHTAPTDMRKSYDTLAALVVRDVGRDLLSGDVFLFVGRSRRLAKALYWDGTGLVLVQKRLETGLFAAPWARTAKASISLHAVEPLMIESKAITRMSIRLCRRVRSIRGSGTDDSAWTRREVIIASHTHRPM